MSLLRISMNLLRAICALVLFGALFSGPAQASRAPTCADFLIFVVPSSEAIGSMSVFRN
jgi:hypothetical protein